METRDDKPRPVQLRFSVISDEEAADRFAFGLMDDEELERHVSKEKAGQIRTQAAAWKRNHKFTEGTRTKFLEELAKTGNVSVSAFRAGVSREAAYHLRDRDEDFKRQFDDARESAGDVLELEAWRRAVKGVEKPVYYQGVQCGVVPEYSDSLLKTLLVAARPYKYSDRMIQANADVSPDDIDAMIEAEMSKVNSSEKTECGAVSAGHSLEGSEIESGG